MNGATPSGLGAPRRGLRRTPRMRAAGWFATGCSICRALSPMPAGKPVGTSRRTALTGRAGMLAAGCGRLEFMAANVPAVFGDYRGPSDIPYGADPQQRLAVYVPGRVSAPPRPLVVFWHGGRWRFGDKAEYRFVGAALADLGLVAVLPNYRHYPDVKMPGFMGDAASAGQWAAAHAGEFGADPSRLYLMGHSAGAHMAALVTLDPRYFSAAGPPRPPLARLIGFSGPHYLPPPLRAGVQNNVAA